MVDVFEEVDEQLRSDQLQTLFRKYLPWAAGGLAAGLVVALAVWGVMHYRQTNAEKASAVYAQGTDSLGRGDQAIAFAQFGEAAKDSSGVYRSLALQQQAGIRLDQNKTAEAVQLFDQAAKAASDPVVGDAARLKSAYALMDTASYADIEARLTPLANPQRPYSSLARLGLAFAKLKAGKVAEARSDFVVLSLLPTATDDMRQIAKEAEALIDSGSTAQLAATVKEAITMPSNPLFPQGVPAGAPAPTNPQPGAGQ